MPQPQPNESDPLLAFFVEQEKPADPVQLTEAAKDPPADDLRMRVERTERQIERALIDISTLKSDQAKLVSAIEDIRKRLSRPPDKRAPVVALSAAPLPKGARARTIAAIFALIALGAAVMGLAVQEGVLGML